MSDFDSPSYSYDPSASAYEATSGHAAGARARRRRARRMLAPQDAAGQAEQLAALARRAHPTFELFVFALVSGAVLGLGFLLDSQPILFLGVLVAPLLTPWVGMLLALVVGSPRFFFETFMALLIGVVLVFLTGLLAGFAARLFLPRTFDALYLNSRLWLPELIVLVLGAALLVASFVRSEARPFLPSLVVAYAFFLPASAAGVGLGTGVPGIWPQGAFVFITHFALAALVGLLTLLALRLKPNVTGVLGTVIAIVVLTAALAFLMGPGPALAVGTLQPIPPPAVGLMPTASPSPSEAATSFPSLTPTATIPPTPSATATLPTLPPSETPTITMTIEPTPVLARIVAEQGGGAVLRETAAGNGVSVLDNFTIVEVLPETQDVSGWTWTHVRVDQNGVKREGWVLQLLLDYSTPPPAAVPSGTPAA